MKFELQRMEYMTGDKRIQYADGYVIKYNDIALHLRHEGTLWIISLFNSGLLTHGSGRTIQKAIMNFEEQEGKAITNWKYERGCKTLYTLKDYARDYNKEQIVKYSLTDNFRLQYDTEVKAGDLI